MGGRSGNGRSGCLCCGRRGWIYQACTHFISAQKAISVTARLFQSDPLPRGECIEGFPDKRQGSSGDGSKAVTENTTKEEQENIGVCDICGAETEVVQIIYGSSSVKYCRECLLDFDLNDAT